MNNGLELYLAHLCEKVREEYNKECDIPEYKNMDQYKDLENPNGARTEDMIGGIFERHKTVFKLACCMSREREHGDKNKDEQSVYLEQLNTDEITLAEALSWWRD